MTYKMIIVVFGVFLYCFDSDNWTYFKKVGSIKSIIEDDDLTHFITSNGIYSYDDISNNYFYNFNLSKGIDFDNEIEFFYFDSNTSMYWFIDNYGIKMKHSFHAFWNEISFRRLNILDINQIVNIGSSSDHIWIKLFNQIIPLDQITGNIIKEDISNLNLDDISWSDQYYQDIDLSRYVIFDDWSIRANKITNNEGKELNPTSQMVDRNNNLWVGTSEGALLKGSTYSHRLEIVEFGLKSNNITTAFLASDKDWWFGDSQFLRTGVLRNKNNFKYNNYFLNHWNRSNNAWSYLDVNNSFSIQNLDVNDLIIFNDIIYMATMQGLILYNLSDNDWSKIDSGLHDQAIWDIEYSDNSIFVATSNGYNEISTLSQSIITSQDLLSELLKNNQVYDIFIDGKIMYVASEIGLFEKHFNINNYKLLSEKKVKNISKYNNNIFINDDDLWKLNLNTLDVEKIETKVINFSVFENFIWINHGDYSQVINLRTNKSWRFNCGDIIQGSFIYNILSNDNETFFMTNDGVTIYSWDRGEYE